MNLPKINVNDTNDLPDTEWFDNPPDWFKYMIGYIVNGGGSAGQVYDALERISPYGAVPEWFQEMDK